MAYGKRELTAYSYKFVVLDLVKMQPCTLLLASVSVLPGALKVPPEVSGGSSPLEDEGAV